MVNGPIPLVWLPAAPEPVDGEPGDPRRPGMCYPAPFRHQLSEHFKTQVAHLRPPIEVVLPMRPAPGRMLDRFPGVGFCIDSHPSGDPAGAWTVTCPWPIEPGSQPLITVEPSINVHGMYHGYVTAGVITPDLEA